MRNLNIKIFCDSKNGIKNLFRYYTSGLIADNVDMVTDEREKTITYIQNNTNVWVSFQRTPDCVPKKAWYIIECSGQVIDQVYYEIQRVIAEKKTGERLYFVIRLKGVL